MVADSLGPVPAETPYPPGLNLRTGHELRDASWCWRPRGTPTALLVHTRRGQAVLRVDGTHEEAMSTGDTLLWMPGAPQDFGCRPGPEPWDLVWVHFTLREGWDDWIAWPRPGAGIARVPAPPARLLARIDAALLETDQYAHSAIARGPDLALNALERAVLWLDAANPGSQPLDDRVREAVLFIAGNLGRPLDVRTIADAVHLSPSRLAHLFTEHLGSPPGRFVELRRMQRAQSLLESSSLSIGAIARISGFSSPYYFAGRFKAFAGVSPSDWRQRVQRATRDASGTPDLAQLEPQPGRQDPHARIPAAASAQIGSTARLADSPAR